MKVVHILPTDVFGVVAGAERFVLELARAMARCTPTTLITFGEKSFVREEKGLRIFCEKPWFFVKGIKINPFALGFLKELSDADIIHVHQLYTVVTDLVLLYAMVFRKKVFVTDLCGSANFSLSYHLPLWKKIDRLLLVSQNHVDRFRKLLPLPSGIIYCGVDANFFTPAPVKRSGRLIYCGRILPFKGLELLIKAMDLDMELDIVGQAYDKAYFVGLQESASGKKVRFLTEVSDQELIQLYREARVTVIPSTREGGMTTSMESMACGTPVISSAIDSLPEIIVEGETGFLIPAGDVEALRASIKRFYDQPELSDTMGKKAREDMEKRFTWDAIVELCFKEYKKTKSNGRNHGA